MPPRPGRQGPTPTAKRSPMRCNDSARSTRPGWARVTSSRVDSTPRRTSARRPGTTAVSAGRSSATSSPPGSEGRRTSRWAVEEPAAEAEARSRVRFEPPEHNTTRDLRERDGDELHPEPKRDDGVTAMGDGRMLVHEAPQDDGGEQGRGEGEDDERVARGDPHVGASNGNALLGPQTRPGDEGVER